MVLTTRRLVLRPFTAADAPAFYDYARDPRVGIAAGWRPHKSLEETRQIIREVMSGPHIFAVEERDSGLLVGSAGFTGQRRGQCQGPSDEIGYSFRPDRWGRGYATEAVGALLVYGFERMALQEVWATRYEGNEGSRRVLEKSGFTHVFSQWLSDDLGEHLVHFYVLTREVWQGGEKA